MAIKIITLNCWGIPVFSKDRRLRMLAIAEYLATSNYDIVCLQEVWMKSDFHLIKDKVIEVLPHSHYFYSGVFGSGVCILSKHQIQDVFFHQWPLNGYVHKLQHGDWFGGKGIGLCCLRINDFQVNVYSAHLHAEYNPHHDEYHAHRILQAYDTAQFIQLTSGRADLIVLAGDLNTKPGDLAYRLILETNGFKDSFMEADEDSRIRVGTNENHENSYTEERLIKSKAEGARIDYVLYHSPSNISVDIRGYALPLPERVPRHKFSYSDHEAVSATFAISRRDEVQKNVIDSEKCCSTLKESIEVYDCALRTLKVQHIMYYFITAFFFIILMASIPFDAPYFYRIIVHAVRLFVTLFMCFTFVMATIWNRIERNGILSAKLAMEVKLKQLSNIQ